MFLSAFLLFPNRTKLNFGQIIYSISGWRTNRDEYLAHTCLLNSMQWMYKHIHIQNSTHFIMASIFRNTQLTI